MVFECLGGALLLVEFSIGLLIELVRGFSIYEEQVATLNIIGFGRVV